jgi:hypothetical protein
MNAKAQEKNAGCARHPQRVPTVEPPHDPCPDDRNQYDIRRYKSNTSRRQ